MKLLSVNLTSKKINGHFTKNFCIVLLVFKIFVREGHRFYYSCSTTKFLVLSRSRTLVCGPSRFCFSVGGPSASLKLGKKGGNQGGGHSRTSTQDPPVQTSVVIQHLPPHGAASH